MPGIAWRGPSQTVGFVISYSVVKEHLRCRFTHPHRGLEAIPKPSCIPCTGPEIPSKAECLRALSRNRRRSLPPLTFPIHTLFRIPCKCFSSPKIKRGFTKTRFAGSCSDRRCRPVALPSSMLSSLRQTSSMRRPC